jgi:hypothetical protein
VEPFSIWIAVQSMIRTSSLPPPCQRELVALIVACSPRIVVTHNTVAYRQEMPKHDRRVAVGTRKRPALWAGLPAPFSVAHIELSHRLIALHIYDRCNLLSLRYDDDVIDIATGSLQHLFRYKYFYCCHC